TDLRRPIRARGWAELAGVSECARQAGEPHRVTHAPLLAPQTLEQHASLAALEPSHQSDHPLQKGGRAAILVMEERDRESVAVHACERGDVSAVEHQRPSPSWGGPARTPPLRFCAV